MDGQGDGGDAGEDGDGPEGERRWGWKGADEEAVVCVGGVEEGVSVDDGCVSDCVSSGDTDGGESCLG